MLFMWWLIFLVIQDHRCMEECVLSQCSVICPCGPERNWIVIWKVPVPVYGDWAGVPHGPVHISGDCWDLLPWVVCTIGDRRCDKALLHFVTAGPRLHWSERPWLHWKTVLFVIFLLAQKVPEHPLEDRCQFPGHYVVSGEHLTKSGEHVGYVDRWDLGTQELQLV